MRRWWFLIVAGCGASQPTVAPVIDLPATTSAAYPYTDLDSIELSVAVSGSDVSLSSADFTAGKTPVLTDLDFGSDLVIHMSGRSGVQDPIEVAYGRSCVLDLSTASAVAQTPHIFFSRIVKWAAGASPAAPARTHASAYAALGGSAIFIGGDAGETSIERFDPSTGAFSTLGGVVGARTGAVVAPLSDGYALLLGGATDAGPVGYFELLSPRAQDSDLEVAQVSDDRVEVVGHAAATLVDGTVVLIGGDGADGVPTGATWLYSLGDAHEAQLPRLLSATLAVPRADHSVTRLGDDVGAAVLVIGGRDASGAPVARAEVYEPLREAYADFAPQMVTPRYGQQSMRLPDGSVLIVGGRDASGVPVNSVELYQPTVGQFAVNPNSMPAGAGLNDFSMTSLPDGRVLLAGGLDANDQPVTTTLIARLDPLTGTVDLSPTDGLSTTRAGQSAVLLCDGTVFVVGGTSAAGAAGSERYNPPSAGRR